MGKYRLVRRLAVGGMAEVFLAKAAGPMGFEKELVVKRILPHLAEDPQFVEMFLAEAKLAARLNHGNVVQIFDFGEQEQSYFIAMEYVEGLNLKTLSRRALHRGTPISYPLLARIVAQACEGLAYAHDLVNPENGQPLGFIHRDISTDNILVSTTGGVKVVDFGIAKAANQGPQTMSGVLKGKLAYMPPEYLLGTPIDARADIYALGIVLYELIAGRRPFVADTEPQLMQLIIYEKPVDVGTLRADVPMALVQVIERALHKDRESRYASCRQMQADLERFLFRCGEPVGALQIAELVKTLAVAPDPPARSTSREVPATDSGPGSTASPGTRPMRTPSTHSITRPLEVTLVTPPPVTDTTEEDKRLARLVARPRWHIPLIFASVLVLGGAAVLSFSRDAVEEPPPPTPSAPPALAAAQEPQVPPPVDPKALDTQQIPPVSATSPEAPPPVESKPSKRLKKGASKSRSTSMRAPGGGTRSPSAYAFLTVEHSIPGEVYIYIEDEPADLPVRKQPLASGRYEVELSGTIQGHRFSKVKSVTLKEGEHTVLRFDIERVKVQVRGLKPNQQVLKLDSHKLDSTGWIVTYEGWHQLTIVNGVTGKEEKPVDCVVTVGSQECLIRPP